MANWLILKNAIAEAISSNGNQEITGSLLQSTLTNIIDSLGENATFAGIATPITSPGISDGPVFYIASTKGFYPNFNNVELGKGETAILYFSNTTWVKKTIVEPLEQSLGEDENKTMSQKAITENINSLNEGIEKLYSATGLADYTEFSSLTDYAAGDVVLYDGVLFRFKVDHAAGEWDYNDVEEWSEKKEREELGSEVDGIIANLGIIENIARYIHNPYTWSDTGVKISDKHSLGIFADIYLEKIAAIAMNEKYQYELLWRDKETKAFTRRTYWRTGANVISESDLNSYDVVRVRFRLADTAFPSYEEAIEDLELKLTDRGVYTAKLESEKKQNIANLPWAVSRAGIKIEGNVITIGAGLIYINKDGAEIVFTQNESTDYDLAGNKALVYNATTKNIEIVQRTSIDSLSMFPLFIQDVVRGIFGGLLYEKTKFINLEGNDFSICSLISRAPISTSGFTITIGVGEIYIFDFKNNKQYIVKNSTETTYDLSYESGKPKVLVYNTTNRAIEVVLFSEYDETEHILLIQYDKVKGFRNGALYPQLQNDRVLSDIESLSGVTTNNNNNKIECVSRAQITYTNRVLTIGNGNMYFRCGNKFKTFTNQNEYTYTFTGSKTVVLDTTNNTIIDRENNGIKITDIPLLWYDGVKGIDGGVLLKYIQQSNYDAKILELGNRITEKGVSLFQADLSDLMKPVMHGGTSAFPQNNLALYKMAGKNGVLFWEGDVRPCLDGFVLSHDNDMYQLAVANDGSAISPGEYLCSQKTVAELKTLRVGVKKGTTSLVSGFENERIPTLEEFLTLCKIYGACPVLELKFGDSSRAEDLYNIVKKMGMLHKTIWLLYAGRNAWGNALHSLDDRNNIVYCGDASLPSTDVDEIISFKTEKNIVGLYYYISTLTDEIIARALENEVLIGTWEYTSTNNWNELLGKGYSMFSLDNPTNNPLLLLR